MITYDQVVAVHPEAARFPKDTVEAFVTAANVGLPDARFKSAKSSAADAGRIDYVMHMLTKPALNLSAPHVLARAAFPGRSFVKTPHHWDSTSFGKNLKAGIRA